ncbi:hypothetical protein CERSUDRAFT_95472 [Gelatoporia subvermispora B]|uniref:Uncharacterized protein n=1 Tax=Ceriporiopsis subvermispora (strain B) TaxID=914234 RepID=M2QJJ6_CERS8|nr:hypothetical protein CERSUDRAFT_95472 [Gelatoporia subvermispora B]
MSDLSQNVRVAFTPVMRLKSAQSQVLDACSAPIPSEDGERATQEWVHQIEATMAEYEHARNAFKEHGTLNDTTFMRGMTALTQAIAALLQREDATAAKPTCYVPPCSRCPSGSPTSPSLPVPTPGNGNDIRRIAPSFHC